MTLLNSIFYLSHFEQKLNTWRSSFFTLTLISTCKFLALIQFPVLPTFTKPCIAVHGVTKSWTRLSDWTELSCEASGFAHKGYHWGRMFWMVVGLKLLKQWAGVTGSSCDKGNEHTECSYLISTECWAPSLPHSMNSYSKIQGKVHALASAAWAARTTPGCESDLQKCLK